MTWRTPSGASTKQPATSTDRRARNHRHCAAPAGIAAIILGHKALRQIRRTDEGGYGLAKAGLILGYFGLVLAVFGLLITLLASNAASVTPESALDTIRKSARRVRLGRECRLNAAG